jgi:hypothetical protein
VFDHVYIGFIESPFDDPSSDFLAWSMRVVVDCGREGGIIYGSKTTAGGGSNKIDLGGAHQKSDSENSS